MNHNILRRTFVLLVGVLLGCFPALAQTEFGELNWIKDLKVPNVQDIDILKLNEDVLLYKSTQSRSELLYPSIIDFNKNYLYLYNRRTQKTIEKSVTLKDGEQRRTVEAILFIHDTIHVISSFRNEAHSKIYIFDETMNSSTLEFNNNAKKIHEIDYGSIEGAKITSLNTLITYTNGRVLTYSSFKFKHGRKHFFNLYDLSGKENLQYNMSTEDDKTNLYRYISDYEGNLYTLEANKCKKGEQEIQTLKFFRKGQNESISKTLEIEGIRPNMMMAVNRKNELICAGTCFRLDKDGVIGTFSMVYPAYFQGERKLTVENFSNEYLTKGMKEKDAAKLRKRLDKNDEFYEDYFNTVDTIHIAENGDFTLMSEMCKIKRYKFNGSYEYNYYYGDIYVTRWNADGSLKWNRKIYRDEKLGYAGIFAGHYFPFYGTDNTINFMYYIDETMETASKGPEILMTSFDALGNEKTRTVLNNKKEVKRLFPAYCRSLSPNKVVLTSLEMTLIPTSAKYYVAEMPIK